MVMQTVRAIVRQGRIELLEAVPLEEGAHMLVTVLSSDDEQAFWLEVSGTSADSVWDNSEDDVYAQLLAR
jgi:hypothetical protein